MTDTQIHLSQMFISGNVFFKVELPFNKCENELLKVKLNGMEQERIIPLNSSLKTDEQLIYVYLCDCNKNYPMSMYVTMPNFVKIGRTVAEI